MSARTPCPVPGCPNPVRPTHLACGRHWFRLPPSLRAKVWRAYKAGAGGPQHLAVVAEAIGLLQAMGSMPPSPSAEEQASRRDEPSTTPDE